MATKVGSEFRVSTQTVGNQVDPRITSLSNGGFVVTWEDNTRTLGDSSGISIKAQVYAADGSKIGSEFLVNTQTASDQFDSSVTGLSNGGFVVSWTDWSGTLGDGSGSSVKAQLFAADGSKVGSEFLVNTQTASSQGPPTITGLSNGGFVVTWTDSSGTLGDESGTSIKAQAFAADGSKVGSEFLVNTQTAGSQGPPTVTGLSNGGFVVTWTDHSGTLADGSGTNIKAQVFAADGSRIGTEFLVNTATQIIQSSAAIVAALSDGGFVVTWETYEGTGVYAYVSVAAQVFTADGARVGSEFRVNTSGSPHDWHPTVTGLSGGGFVASWDHGEANGTSVRAQIFAVDSKPPATPTISNASVVDGYVNAVNDTAAQALSGTAEAASIVRVYLNGSSTPSYTTTADASGNWRVVVGRLAEGSYSYTATATDASGNRSVPGVALNFVVDTSPPVETITSVTTADPFTTDVSGTVGAADAGRTIMLFDSRYPPGSNPQAWQASVTTDANGNWTISDVPWEVFRDFTVTASDAAGNSSAFEFVYGTSDALGRSLGFGGHQLVYGMANGFTIDSGGEQNVSGSGTAVGTMLNAGGIQYDWGTAANTTINGGTQYVWGTAIGTLIAAGAQHVSSGSTASNTMIRSGGTGHVHAGGTATNTTIAGGVQHVDGTAEHTAIGANGIQHLHGSAIGTTVNSDGQQKVYLDGVATGTTLNAGGVQYDWGTAIDTTINGGTQYVWGTATGTLIAAGVQHVSFGSTASNTTIQSGGVEHVHAGGAASNTAINGGVQNVNGTADHTVIGANGIQHLHGSATDTTIDSGGQQNVYLDGVATGTTVNTGGVQTDWGTAIDATINGGTQYVWGTASGTIVWSGAQHVGSGGIASNTVIEIGGFQYVDAGGWATNTTINGGNQYVWGTATGTTIAWGAQHVGSGGSAIDTTIDSGGVTYVEAGGAAHDVTFAGPDATLVLAQSSALTGSISGWEFGDGIELGDILFDDVATTLAYVANAGNTGGTLTISDGTHTAELALLGQYTADDFAASSNGHGGTLITDPTAENWLQYAIASQPWQLI